MNKSKRIKVAKDPSVIHDKKKDRVVNPKVLTISSIVFVVILVGALLFDQLYESTLLKVDGEKYTFHDLSYYFYTIESQYQSFDQMFGGSGTYWDMTYDETTGTTVREYARQQAIENALYNEVLYNQAVTDGYALTEEEKSTVDTNVTNMLEQSLSAEVIAKNKFTKEYLTDVLSKTALVSRYRKDKIDALDIDDEAIKAGVSFDEFKQYDVEYLFVSKKTTDSDGNSVDKTADEITAAKEKLTTYYETAKTAEDWSKIVPEDEKDVKYQTSSFIASDTTFADDLEAKIMAMDNNQISDIMESDAGYYVVRMKNNNSSERYDTEVKNAISDAENTGFDKVYQEILAKHKYKINNTVLKTLTMGTLTLAD